jgi:hypothetical protein
MKTITIKRLAVLGLGAVVIGVASTGLATADERNGADGATPILRHAGSIAADFRGADPEQHSVGILVGALPKCGQPQKQKVQIPQIRRKSGRAMAFVWRMMGRVGDQTGPVGGRMDPVGSQMGRVGDRMGRVDDLHNLAGCQMANPEFGGSGRRCAPCLPPSLTPSPLHKMLQRSLPGRQVVAPLKLEGIVAQNGVDRPAGGGWPLRGRHRLYFRGCHPRKLESSLRQVEPGAVSRIGDVVGAVQGAFNQRNQRARKIDSVGWGARLIADDIKLAPGLGQVNHGCGEALSVDAEQPGRASYKVFPA